MGKPLLPHACFRHLVICPRFRFVQVFFRVRWFVKTATKWVGGGTIVAPGGKGVWFPARTFLNVLQVLCVIYIALHLHLFFCRKVYKTLLLVMLKMLLLLLKSRFVVITRCCLNGLESAAYVGIVHLHRKETLSPSRAKTSTAM